MLFSRSFPEISDRPLSHRRSPLTRRSLAALSLLALNRFSFARRSLDRVPSFSLDFSVSRPSRRRHQFITPKRKLTTDAFPSGHRSRGELVVRPEARLHVQANHDQAIRQLSMPDRISGQGLGTPDSNHGPSEDQSEEADDRLDEFAPRGSRREFARQLLRVRQRRRNSGPQLDDASSKGNPIQK